MNESIRVRFNELVELARLLGDACSTGGEAQRRTEAFVRYEEAHRGYMRMCTVCLLDQSAATTMDVTALEGAIFTPDEGLLLQSILLEVVYNAQKFERPHIGALANGLLPRIARAVHDPASVPEEKKH